MRIILIIGVLVTEGHQYGSCFEMDACSWVVAKKESGSFNIYIKYDILRTNKYKVTKSKHTIAITATTAQ
jgi:hypothetical protein